MAQFLLLDLAVADAAGAILHKLCCPAQVSTAHQIANAELHISIQGGPSPSIAPSFRFFLGGNVLSFRPDKIPNFIALQSPNLEIADVFVMVSSTNIEITTDGHRVYLEALENAFGADIDYAQLQEDLWRSC